MPAVSMIMGLDHLPKGTTQGVFSTGFGLGYSGLPIVNNFTSTLYNYIDNEGWLINNGSTVRYMGMATPDCAPLGKPRIAFGCRFKFPLTSIASTTSQFVAITSGSVAGGSVPAIFTYSDFTDIQLGKEYHLEFEVIDDGTNIVINRYVDGVQLTPLTLSAQVASAWRAGTTFVRWNPQYTTTVTARIRDIIVSYSDTLEESARLGPVRLEPITLDFADAADWTTSNGDSVESVLSTPFQNSGDLLVPYAQNSLTEQPIHASLGVNFSPDEEVKAINLFYTAKNSEGSAVRVGAAMSLNGQEIQLGEVALSSTWQFGISLGIHQTAPDGSAWSEGTIDNTTLTLSPLTGI